MSALAEPESPQPYTLKNAVRWYGRGARSAVSIPGLMLVFSFVGFAGLARESGLTLLQSVFMTMIIWALPAKVVLVGAITSGTGILGAAFAVALSSIRLMPMVVALVPEMRTPRTRTVTLYFLSHFIAVTSWVMAMERLRHIPENYRTSWYFGAGSTLVMANMLVVGVVFALAGSLPPAANAALLFLTPIYFLTSLWGTARERAGRYALIFGMVIGPIISYFAPEFSLLGAGIIGGGAAFLLRERDA
ncbi:AzlC family ABC transporter permease [Limoniibacter endophyticus]|nr:AzlC family ABC transporter permease [Limoniibacter endophyticus]